MLPDIFVVAGVELRVGSKSDCTVTETTLVSLFFRPDSSPPVGGA